ncbi:HNH endonuclease [Arthrobacter sp. I2-34]|uniref:HNH endonuclease n=1 Tax=Arthrobacter hankyongi TaxID=2904801 RepID=A0ABS9L801_9MICC|nr:HNH endonuclease signature motif containing protein [Arthrobacter hankyongi]MCG2622746.1 HNH endonuclease [Arthrobacter hankyongi]
MDETDLWCAPGVQREVVRNPDSLERCPAVGHALEQIGEGLDSLLRSDFASLSGGETRVVARLLDRMGRRLDAAFLAAVARLEQADAGALGDGTPCSVQVFLRTQLGVAPGRAKADVAAAAAIHGAGSGLSAGTAGSTACRPSGKLRLLGALLAAGQITKAHADTAVRTLEQLPERLKSEPVIEQAAGLLAEHAPKTTVAEIKRIADRLLRTLEADRDDHYDPESFNRRSVTLGTDQTGMVWGHYQLDPDAGAELKSILEPLSAPRPDQKDEHGNLVARDERSPSQRRADALMEAVRAGARHLGLPLSAGDAAGCGQARRDLLFELPEDPGSSKAAKLRSGRRPVRVSIVTSLQDFLKLRAVHQARGGTSAPGTTPDSACAPARSPVGGTAGASGQSPGYGPPSCEQLGGISAGTMARMLCDSTLERVVIDARGAPLDLGLSVRLASPAQRRAIAVRDQGCIFPGCDRPPSWCEAHHVVWYSRGGPTDVGNLCLLCPQHHTFIHTGAWELAMIDGIPYARPTAVSPRSLRAVPFGTVSRGDWIRNGFFDRLKAADLAARRIRIAAEPGQPVQSEATSHKEYPAHRDRTKQ